MSDEFDASINITSAIDWQRSGDSTIKALIESKQAWYDENVTAVLEDWVSNVFTLSSADDFGCAVWANILDVDLYGSEEEVPTAGASTWGFGSLNKNFSNGNFYTGTDSVYEFTTDQKIKMLQLKALILHFPGSTYSLNKRLAQIFGESAVFVIDNLDMSYSYKVNDDDIVDFISDVKSKDLLPHPTGIRIESVKKTSVSNWGFGANHRNFANGNFYDGEI